MEKIANGTKLEYLGWRLLFDEGFYATITEAKLQRVFKQINWWLLHPRRVCREELQQFLGLAIWAMQVHLLLRPFLAPLFRALQLLKSKALVCNNLKNLLRSRTQSLK